MTPDQKKSFQDNHQKVLNSLKFSKIIVPVGIGLLVVAYILWKQFDIEEFQRIQWNRHVLLWVIAAVVLYIFRHLFYAWRLKMLSNGVFNWKKAIELIFIWEFSSAISPTSIGGSTVAFFFLAQEKLSSAKAVSLVLYTVVLDTLFFILTMPFLYLILGPKVIRPDMENLNDIDGMGYTFLLVLLIMTVYGLVFYYGLFINPRQIKRFLLLISRINILGRFKTDLRKTAMDIETSSKELAARPTSLHVLSIVATTGAWLTRFLSINCIIIALVASTSLGFWDQFLLFGRGETMYGITAFSPTPGGSGVAEAIFGGFYSDFVPKGIAVLAALLWRIITYYPYLIIGVIIVPYWIGNIFKRKKLEKTTSN